MAAKVDPYEVLGVSRDAGPEEIRLAYRKAVLKYHPDSRPGEPAEAARRFRELTEAYQTVLRSAQPAPQVDGNGGERQKFTPEDLGRLELWWDFVPPAGAESASERRWRHRPGARKVSYATVNERLIFVCFWALAIAVAVVAACFTIDLLLIGRRPRELHTLDILIVIAVTLGTYAAAVAATLFGLILTRKIVWRIIQLGFRGRRSLPPTPKGELPRTSTGRELPSGYSSSSS